MYRELTNESLAPCPGGTAGAVQRRWPTMLRALGTLLLAGTLDGCNAVILHPAGSVALAQRNLIVASTVLMLLIIVPVIVLTLIFARHYREGNAEAVYDPDWHHSTQLEVVIWSAPLMIIIALGAITWLSTHILDPYRTLERIDGTRPVPPGTKPLTIEVVALDWKWMFFYPDLGIATINEVAAPVDVPVAFKITSATVMNSFFIPALAGQVYAMAGMQTQLHAVINKEGDYEGFSANYSGAGFSHMNFTFHGLTQQAFNQWVTKVKSAGTTLDRAAYMKIEKPSEQAPVQYFSHAATGLFNSILNMCVEPSKICEDDMNRIDAMGGAGKHSLANKERLQYDNISVEQGHEAPGATFPASGRPAHSDVEPEGMKPRSMAPDVNQPKSAPDMQQGHAMPGAPSTVAPAQLNNKTNDEHPQ